MTAARVFRGLKAWGALSLLLPFLMAGCGEREEGRAKLQYQPYLLAGMKAPFFTGRNMENRYVNFFPGKGEVILLTFWKKSCEECLADLAAFERLRKRFEGKPFSVVAVNGDNLDYVPSGRVIDFVNEKGFGFTVYLDDQYMATERYKVIRLPTTFLIDREGVVVEIWREKTDWESAETLSKIERLLSGPAAPLP